LACQPSARSSFVPQITLKNKRNINMLVENWRAVIRRAWSVKLNIIAALLSGAEVALPMLEGVIAVPAGVFAATSGLVAAAALLARVVAQEGLSKEPEK
jgi:hypothetical protein